MAMKIDKEGLREFALKETGADMIGFANIERFEECPPDFHPRSLNRHTRTVIVVGMRILRGALRSLEQGTGRIAYNAYGYGGVNANWMPDALRKIALFIEDRGREAVPVIQWTGMPPLEPIINHRMAAVAAGLGEIGHSKIVLTKRFGPMQRFGMLLTDASVPPDPLRLESICDRCFVCVRDCPVGAMSRDTIEETEIEGRKLQWGKLDVFQCGMAHPGAHATTTPYMPEKGFDISKELAWAQERLASSRDDIERRAVAEEVAVKVKEKYHHPIHTLVHAIGGSRSMCGGRGCLRSCYAHLEQSGRIDSRFELPFREKGKGPDPMQTYTEKASEAVVQRSSKKT